MRYSPPRNYTRTARRWIDRVVVGATRRLLANRIVVRFETNVDVAEEEDLVSIADRRIDELKGLDDQGIVVAGLIREGVLVGRPRLLVHAFVSENDDLVRRRVILARRVGRRPTADERYVEGAPDVDVGDVGDELEEISRHDGFV